MSTGILDIEQLKQIMGDEKETLISFFDLFKEQSNLEIPNLEKSISEQNWIKSAEISHKLKSSYGSIGSTEAYNVLSKIEQNCKNNEAIEEIPELYKDFLMIQEKIIIEMDNFSAQ